MTSLTFSSCCLKSFDWNGSPTGHVSTLASLPTYITGSNASAAVLYIHDALGWEFVNARFLADHFAREANVTVYMPDFFGGEVLDAVAIKEGRWADLDMKGFSARNARDVREPEIMAVARELRARYKKLGTVGYCFGGWAVLVSYWKPIDVHACVDVEQRLGAKEHDPPLVDCVVCAHPSWATNDDIDGYGSVPVMFLAPEKDSMFPDEMKEYAFRKLVSLSLCRGWRNTKSESVL
jgi:dienelactone hydrolase